MNKNYLHIIASAILFLFFFQMAGTLIESIYILDLLNTSLDAKVLGVLFFFTPVLLFPFRKKAPGWLVGSVFAGLFLARGIAPNLGTAGRLLASGIATGTALLLIPLLAGAKTKGSAFPYPAAGQAGGLALAVVLSVLLRTADFSLDYSLTSAGSWVGWGLGIVLGWILLRLDWDNTPSPAGDRKGVTAGIFGIVLALALVYFVFSAPDVVSRWTEGSYLTIVIAVSLLAAGWVFLSLARPGWIERISRRTLLAWNLAFALALAGTILVQRVAFPASLSVPPVVVAAPGWLAYAPLALMLALFPVVFADLQVFSRPLQRDGLAPAALAPGMLLGGLFLVALVFIDIFTNVWGYVQPVSLFFRNKFWLPFVLIAGAITLLGLIKFPKNQPPVRAAAGTGPHRAAAAFLALACLGTLAAALRTDRAQPRSPDRSSLVVMTYNIQQANDRYGEKSYLRQLALIRQVSPDVLAIEEGDSARISLNNNDYVRYYASQLGYYSYYGPTTVTGTFGTAILSKYPLRNTRTVFSFSDRDEIGTAEAEIVVGGRTFTIYCVHPDGTDLAKLAFARTLLARSKGKANVIALGDYNLRDNEELYQEINAVFPEAWTSLYPDGNGPAGATVPQPDRIDHIFISPGLGVRNPVYLPSPASATDHPAYWAEIVWGN